MSHKYLLLSLLFLCSTSGTSQTSNQWQKKYGLPEAERFSIRSGLTLTAFYSAEGQTCKAVIEADKPQPSNIFEEILEDVIPQVERGKREQSIGLGDTGGGISSTRYERVTIVETSMTQDKTLFISKATVDWNGIKCKSSRTLPAALPAQH